MAWFLAVKLKQKFSARQSVGNCTDGNWRAAFFFPPTPHPTRRHHVILVLCHGEMVFTELAAVLSQRVVLQGQRKKKKKQGGHYDHIQQMHLSLFLSLIRRTLQCFSSFIVRAQIQHLNLISIYTFFRVNCVFLPLGLNIKASDRHSILQHEQRRRPWIQICKNTLAHLRVQSYLSAYIHWIFSWSE